MRVIDILTAPWAIVPDRLEEITGIYSTHLRGEKIDIQALEARMGAPLARKEQGYEVIDGVAVIPVDGVISKKMNLFSQISGGASTQLIERDFRDAMADPEVHSIILHADTPGGSVDGTANLAETIFEARGSKPIYTLADGMMASAGVWIGSAADKVFITSETAITGSIGVVTQHVDYSERNKAAGVTVTEIYAGKYKRISSSTKPLSEEGQAVIQSEIDYLYSIFVDTVAKHRGTTSADVLENMADGKIFVGQQAIDAGLVDGVATLDQLIQMLNSNDEHLGGPAGSAGLTSRPGAADNQGGAQNLGAEDLTNGEPLMNLAELKEQYPELVAEAIAEASAELTAAGAENERERIQSVLAQSMPGHEALVNDLAFDGKTTGPEAAVCVLQSEKARKAVSRRARQDDAEELNGIETSVDLEDSAPAATMTEAEKAKADWERSAEIRAEFEDNFSRYSSYVKNYGRVKVLGGNS